MDCPSTRALIFRASVVEPWRIITAIHTRDPEKDLHMKDQAETATGKREGDLKDDRPGNVEDRHHYPHLSHLVPRKAERPPASQAEVLDRCSQRQDSASSRNLLCRRERQDAQSGSDGGDHSSRIDSGQPTSNGVLDRRIDCLENAIKQIVVNMGLFQHQDQHGDNSHDVDQNSVSGAHGNEHEACEEQQVQDGRCSVSDGVHEEPQIQDGGYDRAEEANHDVSEKQGFDLS